MPHTFSLAPFRHRPSRLAAALAAALLASCAISPTPTTDAEVGKRMTDDRVRMFADQEPVTKPLAYPDVAARALKYNLDYRLKAMEGTLSQGLLDVSRWDMFPRLLANAGYVTRSPVDASRTYQIETGVESVTHQTSTERNRAIASAELSWNLLDFGVSYYRARQQADQVMIAEERKRKVVQNILADTRNAYWRALGAQRLSGRIDALLDRSNAALERARDIETKGLMPQPQVLAYQRALLDAIVLLQYRRQELELAKQELGALMNLPPGTSFTLADEPDPGLPAVPADIQRLEDVALARRPELREEDYRTRITSDEVRRAIVSALPGVSFDVAMRYDSNRFLYDNTWTDGGIRLSANLFRLASIPTLMRANEAQKAVDESRRMAQAMAVMTQLRVASLRYGLALSELKQVALSADVDRRLLGYARSAQSARVEGELEVIRNEARALLSEYQRHIAYANAQSAWGRIYNSLGYDVEPPPREASLAEVAAAIDRSMGQWQGMTFAPTRSDVPAAPSAAVTPAPNEATPPAPPASTAPAPASAVASSSVPAPAKAPPSPARPSPATTTVAARAR